jgi:membrane-associated phospholipid phosphatase
MNEILEFDTYIFYLLNGVWTSDWLDWIMPYWRNKYFWIPFYMIAAGLLFRKFGRRTFFWAIWLILVVGLADQVSSSIIKPGVKRERPCNNMVIKERTRILVPCGGGYSFTSSHAANHMAVAVFTGLSLRIIGSSVFIYLMIWALSIGYGQIYVGAHYPLDVVAGSLLGLITGLLVHYLYQLLPMFQIKEMNS